MHHIGSGSPLLVRSLQVCGARGRTSLSTAHTRAFQSERDAPVE